MQVSGTYGPETQEHGTQRQETHIRVLWSPERQVREIYRRETLAVVGSTAEQTAGTCDVTVREMADRLRWTSQTLWGLGRRSLFMFGIRLVSLSKIMSCNSFLLNRGMGCESNGPYFANAPRAGPSGGQLLYISGRADGRKLMAQLRHPQLFVISGYRSSLPTSVEPRDRFRGGSTRPSESNGHINKRMTAGVWTADVPCCLACRVSAVGCVRILCPNRTRGAKISAGLRTRDI